MITAATLLSLMACSDGTGRVPRTSDMFGTHGPPDGPPDTDLPPTTPPPTETGDTSGTGETGHTADTGTVDPCLGLGVAPLSVNLLPGYPSTEEFHFDAHGNLWNASDGDGAVFVSPFGGPTDFFAPYSTYEAAGTRVLPDGSALAVCNEWTGAIDRIDLLTGSQSVLVGGINSPNSIGFDNRGMLYIAAYGSILRWPLAGGPVEVLLDIPYMDFDGITFSPSFDRLYFNQDDGGTVGVMELALDGTVLSISVLVELGLFGAELDGATVDSCGNLYVIDTSGDLYRVDPAGTAIRYYETPGYAWTTSVNFGSGVGGWERDHLYIMERYQGFVDLEIGVDGYPEPHYP